MYMCNKIQLFLLLGLLNLAVTKGKNSLFIALKWRILQDLRYQHFENILHLFSACRTIGGPDPYQRCIFPFIWSGQKYYGCPVDPNNNAIRWCSTSVDRNGYHVTGQGRYGYCDNSCPDHRPLNDNQGTMQNELCPVNSIFLLSMSKLS